jgi:hypothetical protein
MITQYIIVAVVFFVAVGWITFRAIRSISDKKTSCAKDCGCANEVKKLKV